MLQKSTFYSRVLFLLFSIGSAHLAFSQPRTGGRLPVGEPGKCYAKCLIPEDTNAEQKFYPIYTGALEEVNDNVEFVEIEMSKESERWVKKKRPGCQSVDQDDCLVWCLENGPIETLRLPVVIDTSLTSAYEMQRIISVIYGEESGYTDWREVKCANEISPKFVKKLQASLRDKGYDAGPDSKSLNDETRSALKLFQKDNNLPIGQLDYQTLKFLKTKRR